MTARSIDGPRGRFLTTAQAAAYLGVSVPTFKRIVGLTHDPKLTLPGVREWFRPVTIDSVTRWAWLDVFCLGHLLEKRREAGTEPPAAAGDEETDADHDS